jgi:hypothetical protein
MKTTSKLILGGAGIAAAAGIALTSASLASATPESATAAGYSQGYGAPSQGGGNGNSNTDPSKPMRSDKTLLTGDVAAKVTAAAKAKEPTATIQRVETDSDGVYEAHMVRTDGTQIIVQIDKSYTVTNVQTMGQGGAGRAPAAGAAGSATSGSGSTG